MPDYDIVVTIPKTVNWSDYEKELEAAEKGSILNFKVRAFPKTSIGNRCYICYNDNIIGYHFISKFSEKDFQCQITGKFWQGKFIERTGKFHKINPVPMKGFRGYKYLKYSL